MNAIRAHVTAVNIEDEAGVNLLMMAAAMGRADSVSLFLEWGVNVHAVSTCGVTSLMMAAQSAMESADSMALLISAGASLYDEDIDGDSVLTYVNSAKKIDCLRGAGFDFNRVINSKRRSQTPYVMFLATSHFKNRMRMLKALLRPGVFINATDSYGYTTLDRVSRMSNDPEKEILFDYLISKGAHFSGKPSDREWWGTQSKCTKGSEKITGWYISPTFHKTVSATFSF